MESDNPKQVENRIPIWAKITILAQAAIILSFTVGMYQEYTNNLYLQQYVLGLFRSNIVADAMLSMITISVFAIGTFTILGSMSTNRRVAREWRTLSDAAEETIEMPAMPVIEVSPAPKPKRARRPRQRKATN